jgi:3'(2'), 5'-bisphosphate nucleotidase
MQDQRLFHSLHAAIAASEAILTVRKAGFNVITKSDHSPVTDADYAADRAIQEHLSPLGIPLLSEEVEVPKAERQSWNTYWCIDPLDGTREFAAGRDEFAVNIALMQNNEPVQGIIALPPTRTVYFTHDEQAFRSSWDADINVEQLIKRAQPLPGPDYSKPWIATVSRSYLDEETIAYLNHLRKTHPKLEVVRSGSALKFCRLLEGTAHIYPRFAPCMEWDTAAGHALVRAVGLDVFQLNHVPLAYNKNSLLNPDFIVRQR